MMNRELERIRRRKMADLLKKFNKKVVSVRIFDLLLPTSVCGPTGCGPSNCGPAGCGPTFTSENMIKLQTLAYQLLNKYGRDRFRFELVNILDSSIRNYKDVLQILKERKGDALPIIMLNGEMKFVGRVPSLEEFEKEVRMVA